VTKTIESDSSIDSFNFGEINGKAFAKATQKLSNSERNEIVDDVYFVAYRWLQNPLFRIKKS